MILVTDFLAPLYFNRVNSILITSPVRLVSCWIVFLMASEYTRPWHFHNVTVHHLFWLILDKVTTMLAQRGNSTSIGSLYSKTFWVISYRPQLKLAQAKMGISSKNREAQGWISARDWKDIVKISSLTTGEDGLQHLKAHLQPASSSQWGRAPSLELQQESPGEDCLVLPRSWAHLWTHCWG